MAQLLIKNIHMLDGRRKDILIEEGRFSRIEGPGTIRTESDRVIDGREQIAIPGLCNTHTHSAMTLLRGIGDDLDLKRWLKERIWPLEARMKIEHIKAGMELACLEMIKTGTTLFNDMYFMESDCVAFVDKMGIRAVLGEGFIDAFNDNSAKEKRAETERTINACNSCSSGRVRPAVAPHSAYTVSEEGLKWCRETADRYGCPIHIHISETGKEVDDCIRDHGSTPTRYLEEIGLLGPDVIGAHCVHLTDEEISIMKRNGVKISHNPISNMKLSVGGVLPMKPLMDKGVTITLGTDGAASNNSLDMFQTMKITALLSKHRYGVRSIGAKRVLEMATRAGYLSLGLDGGKIEVGRLADLVLLDRNHHSLVPGNDNISNIVYSCSCSTVRYSIIGGETVMEDGVVHREKEIIQDAKKAASDLLSGDGGS